MLLRLWRAGAPGAIGLTVQKSRHARLTLAAALVIVAISGSACGFSSPVSARTPEPATYSVRVYGLATDGTVIPNTPTPTETPTAVPTAAPEPTAVPVLSIADLICSYSWPCSEALTVARCESGLNPNAYNSSSGASGLFQLLIPLHSWRFAGASPFDPVANVRAAYGLWLERWWQPWIVGGCHP